MGAGGSGAGAVSYSTYLQDFHSEILNDQTAGGGGITFFIDTEIDNVSAANPFTGRVAFDPTTRTTEMQAEFDAMRTLAIDTSDEFIAEAINSFTDSHRQRLAQSTNRVAGMFFDINGVVGTAYPAALVALENGFNRDITEFRIRANQAKSDLAIRAANLQLELSRTKLAAEIDEDRTNLDYDSEEEYWVMNALLKGGSALGMIHGGTPSLRDKGVSGVQSVLGGMATGASVGATFGGGAGAGVGAAIGGLSSLLG